MLQTAFLANLLSLLFFLSSLPSAATLSCLACFGRCSCLQAQKVECPPREICYSQQSHFGGFIRKGCTIDCRAIGSKCRTCRSDYCNSHPELKPDEIDYEDCYEQETKEVAERAKDGSRRPSHAKLLIGFVLLRIVF
ncbi:hypothetical protein QR680_014438 [Steinernema hermaphroditum]|uniref:Uncharacterized protein n=1 Tax=Steinernema hermaphroditum TaxID=289476 RepID=A0AA39I8V7_9BILA|nr:hypothetical protein QR680_014438 [Steinernema hermaphroditum]